MFNANHVMQFKNVLLQRQSELIQQLQDGFGLNESQKDSVGELSSYDNHPADSATELYERGKDTALHNHAETELTKINESLHAMDEGTYGICRVCSMMIDLERLQANPTADTCIEHTDSQLALQKRPVEEEVYSSHINPDRLGFETEVAYDGEDAWQEVSRYGSSDTPSDFFEDKASYDDMYANSDEDIGVVEGAEKYSSDHFN